MEDTPYSAFVKLMRNDAEERQPVTCRLGTVTEIKPLTVAVGSNTISAGSLLMDARLRGGFEGGERVALLAQPDGQSFLILCKVVRP